MSSCLRFLRAILLAVFFVNINAYAIERRTDACTYNPLPFIPPLLQCGTEGTIRYPAVILTFPSKGSFTTCREVCSNDKRCISYSHDSKKNVCQTYSATILGQGLIKGYSGIKFWNTLCYIKQCPKSTTTCSTTSTPTTSPVTTTATPTSIPTTTLTTTASATPTSTTTTSITTTSTTTTSTTTTSSTTTSSSTTITSTTTTSTTTTTVPTPTASISNPSFEDQGSTNTGAADWSSNAGYAQRNTTVSPQNGTAYMALYIGGINNQTVVSQSIGNLNSSRAYNVTGYYRIRNYNNADPNAKNSVSASLGSKNVLSSVVTQNTGGWIPFFKIVSGVNATSQLSFTANTTNSTTVYEADFDNLGLAILPLGG